MRMFSIVDLENFSGLKAHTIRAWELRHNILQPGRKENNERIYCLKDVDHLLKISLLNKAGNKISHLAKMDCITIEENLINLPSDIHKKERELNKLIVAMFSSDNDEFDLLLDDIILSFETDEAIKHILIPFLIKAQLSACKNCEYEIDFAITTLRKKLMFCIERASVKKDVNKSVLLFLPKGEFFDLILLYYNYLLKSEGYKIMYLGSNIDVNKLEKVLHFKNPDFLISYVSANNKKGYDELIQFLSDTNMTDHFIIRFDEFRKNPSPDISNIIYSNKLNYMEVLA